MSTKTSSSKISYSPKPAKAELVGIEWLDLNPATPTVATVAQAEYTENTLYNPVQGVGVMFDITPEKFEVAAGFDFEAFNLVDAGMIAPSSNPVAQDLSIDDYYILGSANAEGYARDADNDGYAESFFTDEVEIFLGLVNDQGDTDPTNDEVVGSVEVEIDFKRKVDILLNGGLDIQDVFDSLGTGNLLALIEDIDIKYQANDPTDPLMAGLVIPLATIAAEFVAENVPQLASLISIEADDVNPSKWATGAFNQIVSQSQLQTQPIV